MIKKVFGRKLSRDTSSRQALFRSLIKAFVERGKIVTTKAKAKAVQRDIEKLVTLSLNKDVTNFRRVLSFLRNDKTTTENFFGPIAKAFGGRRGGYTRIINLPPRKGDMAQMARMEWTQRIEVGSKKLEVGKNTKNKKGTQEVHAEVAKKEKPGLKAKVSRLVKSGKK